jgi:hypothetical protein
MEVSTSGPEKFVSEILQQIQISGKRQFQTDPEMNRRRTSAARIVGISAVSYYSSDQT